jgi:hypothetical protein
MSSALKYRDIFKFVDEFTGLRFTVTGARPTGELGRHSKVIEEEMTRRLHSDLK